jgi:hypothetical protein
VHHPGVDNNDAIRERSHREDIYVSGREALEPQLHSETGIPQTPPTGMTRSYNEMNTNSMVFELQGTVHEIKQSIASLTALVERGFGRMESLETSSAEIKEVLRALPPKLEDLTGFTRHQAPQLADRTDIAELAGNLKAEIVRVESHLKTEIDKRPTRYQSFRETAIIVVLVGVFLTIVSYLAH